VVKKVFETTDLCPDMLVKLIWARKAELEKVLIEKEKSLNDAPEGELRFVKKGNSIQYYRKCDYSVPEGIYLKRQQDSFASALAQKDYDGKLICELKVEIKALERILEDYRPERIDEIYMSLHDCRKTLIRPAKLMDEDYVKRWMSVAYEKESI
jgi:hypothetical protein